MKGFFGYSEEETFKYFSLAHFVPIILAAIVVFLIIKFNKKLRNFKYEKTLRFCFAFLMIIAEMSYFWRLIYVGANIEDHLPITVCGWTCIIGAFMLMSENKTLFDITFFGRSARPLTQYLRR